MAIRVSRFVALVARTLLFPIVLVARLAGFLAGRRKPIYQGTIPGDPWEYAGERPLLIAVWSDWASVWTAATADVVERLKEEFAGRCEFAYVEAESKSVTDRYDAQNVPVLILRRGGQEIERFVNVMEIEEVRPALVAATR